MQVFTKRILRTRDILRVTNNAQQLRFLKKEKKRGMRAHYICISYTFEQNSHTYIGRS